MLYKHLTIFLCFAVTSEAWAWGERGHDLVTRVAARILIHDMASHPDFATAFVAKEHMLAHLSNIPDIHWRNDANIGEKAVKENATTHYVDLEYYTQDISYAGFPIDAKKAKLALKNLCKTMPEDYQCPSKGDRTPKLGDAGSVLWRVEQLTQKMAQSFQEAHKVRAKREKKKEAIDQAMLLGGILAHFIGDLGNPYHTTRDYDGWESEQGGIHGYFETDIINAYDLSLDQEVLDWALNKRPANALIEYLPQEQKQQAKPIDIALALALDSFSRLPVIAGIDKTHAQIKPSRIDDGLKLKSQRKEPQAVKQHFRAIAVERLAMAADTLSRLWKLAWIQGNKPDLKGYSSYTYPLAPDYIPVTYE